jgi:hypothetical protein
MYQLEVVSLLPLCIRYSTREATTRNTIRELWYVVRLCAPGGVIAGSPNSPPTLRYQLKMLDLMVVCRMGWTRQKILTFPFSPGTVLYGFLHTSSLSVTPFLILPITFSASTSLTVNSAATFSYAVSCDWIMAF